MGATNVIAKFTGDQCLDEGADATATQLFDETETYFKAAADGAAATATTDQWVWTNNTGGACVLIGFKVWLSAALTADNTNFATFQARIDNGIGGASALAYSLSTTITDSGNFTALATKDASTKGASQAIPAGATVYFAITKSGAGVVVPISGFTFRIRKAN